MKLQDAWRLLAAYGGRLPKTVPHHSVEQFVHSSWRFLRIAIHPPAQKRQQALGQGKSASSRFPLLQFAKTPGFPKALLPYSSFPGTSPGCRCRERWIRRPAEITVHQISPSPRRR